MNSVNLYLQDKIETETVRPLIQRIIEENALLGIDKESSADLINLYITSVGGSVHDGFALTDIILNSKIPINPQFTAPIITNISAIMSKAFIILLCK